MKKRTLKLLLVSALVAGCDAITGTPHSQLIDVMLTASQASLLSSSISSGSLDVTKVEIVLGQASLGNGDQFGCQDCQNSSEEASVAPRLVSVPLDGGAIRVASEGVGPGLYSEVEIEVARLAASGGGAPAGWPVDATIRVSGMVEGSSFEVFVNREGDLRQTLASPIAVGEGAPSEIQATLTLPVLDWFTDGARTLDPRDSADLATIQQRIIATLDTSDTMESEPR